MPLKLSKSYLLSPISSVKDSNALEGGVDISILYASIHIIYTPKSQNRICQAHIDGIPNTHVFGSRGLPKIQLPITAPGPIPKKNHNKVIITAVGTNLHFSFDKEA